MSGIIKARRNLKRCKYGDEVMVTRTFRCTEQQFRKFKALGGGEWLRKILEEAKV